MDFWERWEWLFASVQSLVWQADDVKRESTRLLQFVDEHPTEFDAPDFWQSVKAAPLPFQTVKAWAVEGLNALASADAAWSLLMLDCGDSPDLFCLTDFRTEPLLPINELMNALTSAIIFDSGQFERVFYRGETKRQSIVTELTKHSTDALNDSRFYGYISQPLGKWPSDELLWLWLASASLKAALHDPAYCQSILRGREKIVIISGFEEIFFYLGTITAGGFIFETTTP